MLTNVWARIVALLERVAWEDFAGFDMIGLLPLTPPSGKLDPPQERARQTLGDADAPCAPHGEQQ